MIIGYLALGIFVAFASGLWALVSGLGLLAALGFYVLGGSLAMGTAVCAILFTRLVHQPNLMAAKI